MLQRRSAVWQKYAIILVLLLCAAPSAFSAYKASNGCGSVCFSTCEDYTNKSIEPVKCPSLDPIEPSICKVLFGECARLEDGQCGWKAGADFSDCLNNPKAYSNEYKELRDVRAQQKMSINSVFPAGLDQPSVLKIELQTSPADVRRGKSFDANVKIINIGNQDQILHVWSCYNEHWATDNSFVQISHVHCIAGSADVRLKPGEHYKMLLPLSIIKSAPDGKPLEKTVTFRLQFQQPLVSDRHYQDAFMTKTYGVLIPSGLTVPIWSNYVTLNVSE